MTTQNEKLAKRLQEYAGPRYEQGYDFFIECGMEYCRYFVGDMQTWPEVLDMAEKIVSVLDDRRADANYQIESGG